MNIEMQEELFMRDKLFNTNQPLEFKVEKERGKVNSLIKPTAPAPPAGLARRGQGH